MTLYSLGEDSVQTPPDGSFWVADNASVIGKVTLGRDVSVWFNAVIRADNEPITIGDRSNIQDGSVLHVDPDHPLTIAQDCTIGHLAMLHGCTIEPGVLIGIGAIILNGARIGAGSIVGAGALVAEGKEIPAGSLVVGTPGRVLRQVSTDETARIKQGVATYVARSRDYRMTLKPQE